MKYTCVWITGASDGIGRSLALLLAKQGHSLFLSARNEEKLQKVYEECLVYQTKESDASIEKLVFDCKDISLTKKIAAQIASRVDVAVFCAGVSQRAYAYDMQDESDEYINTVNFLSPMQASKELVLRWKHQHLETRSDIQSGTQSDTETHAQKDKQIIIISSIAAHLPVPLRAMYGASKKALEHYIETLYNEALKDGLSFLRVAIIVPGFVNTHISQKAITGDGDAWGKQDKNQEKGISGERAAKHIVRRIYKAAPFSVSYIGLPFKLRVLRWLYLRSHTLVSNIFSKVSTV